MDQSPIFCFLAAFSAAASAGSEVKALKYQAKPAFTSSRERSKPSTQTLAIFRPYISSEHSLTTTVLLKTMDEVNCFALVPKSWPSSGQSIPSNRTFAAFPFFITNIVSPSPMPAHLPLNVSANVHDADIVKNKDKYRLMAFFLKSDRPSLSPILTEIKLTD